MLKYKIKTMTYLTILGLFLGGCSAHTRELKSPCAPQASLSQNPCNPIPINISVALPNKTDLRISLS
jgi:PBP1b-binding outer membrane lipoprotein LpoB